MPPTAMPTPTSLIALAQDASEFDRVAPALRGLAAAGTKVVLMWRTGEPGPRLRSLRGRVRVAEASGGGLRERAARVVDRLRHRTTGSGLVGAVLDDARAAGHLSRAEAVLPLDDAAQATVDRLAHGARQLTEADLAEHERLGHLWRDLGRRLGDGSENTGRLTGKEIRRLLSDVEAVGGTVPDAHQGLLLGVVEGLHDVGEYAVAHQVMSLVTAAGEDAFDDAMRQGWRLQTLLSAEPADERDERIGSDLIGNGLIESGMRETGLIEQVGPVVTTLTEVADGALAGAADGDADGETDGDIDIESVAAASTLALRLLFHRELHADTLSSPLVEDPDAFLAPWRESAVGRLLAKPGPRRPRSARAQERHTEDRRARAHDRAHDHSDDTMFGLPRVVVVPGTYGGFASGVVTELQRHADVRVVDVAARHKELRGLGLRAEVVRARLDQALGAGDGVLDELLLEELGTTDALFVDWVDRGGLAALMSVPEGVRVTVRIHSMDALSPWIHLADWSRVANLVLVGDPLRRLVEAQLGERLAHVQVHVVPNVLDESRIPTDKTPDSRHRMVMIGWAQRVKDPLFALEVLAVLREQDERWRLRLVGPDFSPTAVISEQRYAEQFRRRLLAPDVRDAVEFTGRTREIGPHLRASGFVLSTSRRESFGLGLVEGAASGAVPVVRDWPMLASLGGARALFPADWVVDSVTEAADRVLRHTGEEAWASASQETLDAVARSFRSTDTVERLATIVLGSATPGLVGDPGKHLDGGADVRDRRTVGEVLPGQG
ncbi:glycosyltransferase [Ornithinimicrobium sp. Y1847]|uniref:glycosyltransferase n=1 Tax=Ornithinimicrobium sp. Y1847 TaxID=3405419 RepID=UPI003B6808E1